MASTDEIMAGLRKLLKEIEIQQDKAEQEIHDLKDAHARMREQISNLTDKSPELGKDLEDEKKDKLDTAEVEKPNDKDGKPSEAAHRQIDQQQAEWEQQTAQLNQQIRYYREAADEYEQLWRAADAKVVRLKSRNDRRYHEWARAQQDMTNSRDNPDDFVGESHFLEKQDEIMRKIQRGNHDIRAAEFRREELFQSMTEMEGWHQRANEAKVALGTAPRESS
ncbi:hypothetical protein F5Y18DRAFT_440940 [Xylariaceae sp. FL1019]|nr:hypothetical protein F5Y18DRAFT_440940 [Xylariaceae sp. FL1019]